MQLNDNILLGSMFGGGILIGFWEKIKSFLLSLFQLIFRTVKLSSTNVDNKTLPISNIIALYVKNNFKKSIFTPPMYGASNFFIRSKKRRQLVGHESVDCHKSNEMYWKGFIPVWITTNDQGCEITTIKGFIDIEDLIVKALAYYNEVNSSIDFQRFNINFIVGRNAKNRLNNGGSSPTSPNGQTQDFGANLSEYVYLNFIKNFKLLNAAKDDIGPAYSKNKYVFISPLVENIYKKAVFWKQSKDWFESKGIAWKLGVMLHGLPGTGKTLLVKTLGEDLMLPVYYFDLASLTNSEFRDGWNQMLSDTPAIALFEDMDAAFDGRKNLSKNTFDDHLSFDCLLNCVDGVEKSEGILLIATTNNLKKVDEAFLRPGRIDFQVEIPLPNVESLKEICNYILDEHKDIWDETIAKGIEAKETMAAFTYRCSIIAQELMWKDFEKNYSLNSPLASRPKNMPRFGSNGYEDHY